MLTDRSLSSSLLDPPPNIIDTKTRYMALLLELLLSSNETPLDVLVCDARDGWCDGDDERGRRRRVV
jgi:hypothetical protein